MTLFYPGTNARAQAEQTISAPTAGGTMALVLTTIALTVGVAGMTWAAAVGKVPPNGILGIRTPATQRSEAAWQAAHRAALPIITVGSGVVAGLCVVAIVVSPRGLDLETEGLVLLVGYTLLIVLGAVVAHRAAKKTAA